MKNLLKLVFITLPLMALGVAFLVYVVANKPAPAQNTVAERITAVRYITATRQPVAPQATGFGIVSPARTYTAIAQVGGIAEYVNPGLEKGAILPAGSVLVRLSPSDFNLAIAQAVANIRAAEAKLAELEVSQANLTASLEIEKQALELVTNDLKRIEKLYASGTASQSTLNAARAAQLAQRQKALSIENSLALLPTQREVQTEQIAVYKANLETAKLNLERTELSLPFDARVASRRVEVGQFVGIGQTVAQLDGIDAAEVEAQLSVAALRAILRTGVAGEPDVQAMTTFPTQFQLDATVRLQLGQGVVEWPATVDRISDTIDQKTGTLGVIVRVDDAYSGARPGTRPPLTKGMFVEVTLRAAPVDGIPVPRSALRDGALLIIDDQDRLARLPVTPYLVQGEIAVVTEGLDPGTRVIVTPPSPLIDAMLLEPHEDTALMPNLLKAGSDQ